MRKRQKDNILELIQTFREVHIEVARLIEAKQKETAFVLLEQCQQGALKIGEMIEDFDKSSPVIQRLEEYCDWLYQEYMNLQEEREFSQEVFLKKGEEFCDILYQAVDIHITSRREVVFLPYKAAMWDSLESVWMAAQNDPYCDAYVVPIPYYDRNSDKSLGKMHDESSLYPSYVPITKYTEYDFENRHPDMIFIHNPYDDSNYVTSVHPFFYSNKLKAYTDCLVYIPYFVLEDRPFSNKEYVDATAHFCYVPAVQHADYVIVQSEQMKETYVEVLTQAFGSHTRKKWESKILGIGSPKMDKGLSENKVFEIPEEWKKVIYFPDGRKKKVVLYNTGISSMLEHKRAMLEKMRNVFSIFNAQKEEIGLLWRPHPLMLSTIQAMCPKLEKPYLELTAWYQKEKCGIYDDTPDLDRALELCDAYYGDLSSLVQLCENLGKPVLIQDVNQREQL